MTLSIKRVSPWSCAVGGAHNLALTENLKQPVGNLRFRRGTNIKTYHFLTRLVSKHFLSHLYSELLVAFLSIHPSMAAERLNKNEAYPYG